MTDRFGPYVSQIARANTCVLRWSAFAEAAPVNWTGFPDWRANAPTTASAVSRTNCAVELVRHTCTGVPAPGKPPPSEKVTTPSEGAGVELAPHLQGPATFSTMMVKAERSAGGTSVT